MNSVVGMELELGLFYKEDGNEGERAGETAGLADLILKDKRNTDNPGGVLFVEEEALGQLEITSNPASSLTDLERDLRSRLTALEEICNDYGLFPASTSHNGAGKVEGRVQRDQVVGKDPDSLNDREVRILAHYNLLGEKKFEQIKSVSGIHIHLDQIEGNLVNQYNLLLAMDPVSFALTSTSPIDLYGNNSINDQRINLIRNVAFAEFPQLAQLPNYIHSIQELESRIKKDYDLWKDNSGLEEEVFKRGFNLGNTGWQPIRKKDDIGKNGTWEVRSPDSAPLDVALAVVALYKGVHDYALGSGIPIRVANEGEKYSINKTEFVLPDHQAIKALEEEAIQSGLKGDRVKQYLNKLLQVAREGLETEELKYLGPIEDMLREKRNPSDQIMDFMHQRYDSERYNPKQAAEANMFARELYVQGMN
jgi:gamma-glutamylcysteine synthetase